MLWNFYRLDRSDPWPRLVPVFCEDTESPMERVKELKLHAFGDPKRRAFFPAPRASSHNTVPFRRDVNRILKDPVVGVDGCIRAREDAKNRRKSRAGRPSDTATTLAKVALARIADDDEHRLAPEDCIQRGVIAWCGIDMADAGQMTSAERATRFAWWAALSEEERESLQATALNPEVPYTGPLPEALASRAQPEPQPQSQPSPHPQSEWPVVPPDAKVWCGLPAATARDMPIDKRRERYRWWCCDLSDEDRRDLQAITCANL